MTSIDRAAYVRMFGPTTGDRIRLADSDLVVEIEKDLTTPGYELLAGAGKNVRDGEGYRPNSTSSTGALDYVFTNATIIDSVAGIIKADIGIRDGLIVGIGKAGNPDVMPDVTAGMVVGHMTTPIPSEGLIVTAGAIETHAHLISPQQSEHALSTGTTTLIGGSPGPAFEVGSGSTRNLGLFLRGGEASPMNFVAFGRGSSDAAAVRESVAAGAGAVKIHEDFGASPAVIDATLRAADSADFAVHLHTDSINEFGFAETTMSTIGDRTIHMYHVEGAGGGHAPDLIRCVGYDNVIPASTNPTNPYTPYALDEGVPMTMEAHNMNWDAPEDVAFAEVRIRPQTMIAEDFLHDMGAISIFGSDTQGMGRVAENIANCWQLADIMKQRVGRLPEEATASADNERVKRYIAKLTVNPAISIGVGRHVGSVEVGKVADLVLWSPAFFGVKPNFVMKNGFVAWAALGDAAGSISRSEPVVQRANWGSLGSAPERLGFVFMSALATDAGLPDALGLRKNVLTIDSVRALRKSDMIRNSALPHIDVDPRTFDVRADGRLLTGIPPRTVSFARRYMLR
ncbi:urease subunit alpha [Rhodococcoides fascians]|uniref:urease subunit alpha n=1 Tax=Rhodococcoides fascians TaxID=1828 RepID=UPI0005662D46|nr:MULTISPECIES: urease subunit alpha [Rhodococcus]OZE96276.1 urease subunit alpha [Rhodococcus sp. 15-1189-1-1a]OZF10821.1 urease subunit alpha [Rhodococcus sp. 14-2686-1-2]